MVDLNRIFHSQSFMGALIVEDIDELVEVGLLLGEISCRGLRGFFLQGEVLRS